MHNIQVKRGKEKAILQRHPWVFSGALETPKKGIGQGEIVRLHDASKAFLAYGYYSGTSKITVRVLEWDEQVLVDEQWWVRKITESINRRVGSYLATATTACRLIHGEADFLPGLIVDFYAGYVAIQFNTAGVELQRVVILEALISILKPIAIVEKSDAHARTLEGLEIGEGLLYGSFPQEISITENELQFAINLADGQKSGYYVDQRDNRAHLATYAKNKTVLDCFSYTGGFGCYAKAAGATHVTAVDSSALATQAIQQNWELNGFGPTDLAVHTADCFEFLRTNAQQYDIVVLDPPKLAPTRSAIEKAQRAYKDVNRLGMEAVIPGGLLATFSCSASMDMQLFKQVIAWAALDAGREVQIIHQFCQPADHPIRSSFPESEYLKGLLCRVL